MGSADTLCCCEYENNKGERSHILAVCCECEALDEMADRCFKCEKIPTSLVDRFLDTILDRLRLPGISGGGATQIDLEVATPIIVIPASLTLAAYGPITSMIVLTLLPYFCFFFYRTWTRKTNRSRTKFFYIWGLVSVIFLYILFETIICRYSNISQFDNIMISVAIFTMFMALLYAKKDPGYISGRHFSPPVFRTLESVEEVDECGSDIEEGFEVIDREEIKSVMAEKESRPEPPDPATWCDVCEREKPLRAGHCTVCNSCVKNRDHHCVWIDSCVGLHNHRSFLVAMAVFVFTGYYGSYVTLCSVCDPTHPHDITCSLYTAYRDFKWGLCYVSAWYVVMVTCVMFVGLIFQVILISQNLTSQELHYASKYGHTRFYLYSTKNPYNKGVFRNWLDFWLKRRYSPNSYSNI